MTEQTEKFMNKYVSKTKTVLAMDAKLAKINSELGARAGACQAS